MKSTSEFLARVRDWQVAMGQPLGNNPFIIQQLGYVEEEWGELLDAQLNGSLKDEVDAIGDIAFTLLGLENAGGPHHMNKAWLTLELICGQRGFKLDEILERVCISNESKFWREEDVEAAKIQSGDGYIYERINDKWVVRGAYSNKVIKPPTYKAPDFSGIL